MNAIQVKNPEIQEERRTQFLGKNSLIDAAQV